MISAALALSRPGFVLDVSLALPGRGVKGRIAGRTLHLGNQRLARELDAHSPELEARLDALERGGEGERRAGDRSAT